jgi:hypothetical protein
MYHVTRPNIKDAQLRTKKVRLLALAINPDCPEGLKLLDVQNKVSLLR